MNLIPAVESARKILYPDLEFIQCEFPIRVPLKGLYTHPTQMFPYLEIWDRALFVEFKALNPCSTLIAMLRIEKYLFTGQKVVAYSGDLWTYENNFYVMRCAQVNSEHNES